MNPVNFPGTNSVLSFKSDGPVNPDASYPDDIPCFVGPDQKARVFFLFAIQPSYEDLQELAKGKPIMCKIFAQPPNLPHFSLFTVNDEGKANV